MNNNIYFIMLIISMISTQIIAQPVSNEIGGLTPAAPNAASFAKYGDIPVDLSSGTPSIGIPIHTIQDGPLSLPISLSYHASGIRVAETASWVGLGWNLNAGGVITRTILGKRDELPNGYFKSGHLVTPETIDNIANDDIIDTEPDIFSFNFGGMSGKFILDDETAIQKVYFIPQKDFLLEIEHDTGGEDNEFKSFTIITNDGTRYIFGNIPNQTTYDDAGIERTWIDKFYFPEQERLSNYISSWYLVRVESADKHYAIDLNYADEDYSFTNLSNCSEVWGNCDNTDGSSSVAPRMTTCNGQPDSEIGKFYTVTNIDGKRLSSISNSTNTCTIDFLATTSREDLSGVTLSILNSPDAKRLDGVVIKSSDYCSQWDFSYNYYNDPDFDRPDYKRLQLTKLRERTCDLLGANIEEVNDIKPYIFSYFGELNSNGTTFFPNRLSHASDHWGFYNGEIGNDDSELNIPEGVTYPYTDTDLGYGSDRNPYLEPTKQGILNQITYPTGGATFFDFELNTFGESARGIIPFADYGETTRENILAIGTCGTICCPAYEVDNEGGTETETEEVRSNIPLTKKQVESGYFSLSFQVDINPNAEDDGFQCKENASVAITAYLPGTTTEVGSYGFNVGPRFFEENNPDDYVMSMDKIHLSELGDFLNYFEENDDGETIKYFDFKLTSVKSRGYFELYALYNVVDKEDAGGLRIKEIITSVDNILTRDDDIIRTFEYVSEQDADVSSGVLFNIPYYAYVISTSDEDFQFLASGESMVPLSGFDGRHLVYRRVIEKLNGNGHKEYTYHYESGITDGGFNFPMTPTLYAAKSGELKTEASFEEENTNPIQKTILTPAYHEYKAFEGHVYRTDKLQYDCPFGGIIKFHYKAYQPRTSAFLIGSTEKLLDGVTTFENYTYDSELIHLSPERTSTTNSDGIAYKTQYDYPFNKSGFVYPDMVAKNMISTPIKTLQQATSSNINVIYGGTRTDYAFYNNETGALGAANKFPRPKNFHKYDYDISSEVGEWTKELTIQNYDTKGNPNEVEKENWEFEFYTWENGLIKSRKFKDFTWTYEYYPDTRLVKQTNNPDNQPIEYQYDGLMRLKEVSARGGQQKTTYDYPYSVTTATSNQIVTTTEYTGIDPMVTEQYFDGLGRPTQTVEKDYAPDGADVIKEKIEYNNYGQVHRRTELPYLAGATGHFITYEYDFSPLNRMLQQTNPDGSTIQMAYTTEALNNFAYYVNTVTDENGHTTKTYTDKLGRKEAVRNANNDLLDYNYNIKGEVTDIITPGGKTYFYTYDEEGKVTKKTIPGGGTTRFTYNDRDLLLTSIDDNANSLSYEYDPYGRQTKSLLQNNPITETTYVSGKTWLESSKAKVMNPDGTLGEWLLNTFTYDSFGRPTQTSAQNHLNGEDIALTDYNAADWVNGTTRSHAINIEGQPETHAIFNTFDYDHRGRMKSTYHKVDNTPLYLLSNHHYNAIDQLVEKNLFGGLSANFLQSIDYTYNNRGWLTHINDINQDVIDVPGVAVTPQTGVDYVQLPCPECTEQPCDPWDDLCRDPVRITTIEPGVEGISPNNLEYNADLFNLELEYNAPTTEGAIPQHNGNISTATWRSGIGTVFNYSYHYDVLDRLTSAEFIIPGVEERVDFVPILGRRPGSITFNIPTDAYSVDKVDYYPDGDIKNLWRKGLDNVSTGNPNAVHLDKLTYGYSNFSKIHLTSVNETANEQEGVKDATYAYDNNGNLTSDSGKGITHIDYNHLNLPVYIEFGSSNKYIKFYYDANGKKLKKVSKDISSPIMTTHYIDGIEYTQIGTTLPELEAIYHSEGRVVPDDTQPLGWRYEFTLTDHLGNSRVMFSDRNGDGIIQAFAEQVPGPAAPDYSEILQEEHYYPFGGKMDGAWSAVETEKPNDYQYNGKEFNGDLGLDWLDYGARWYDPGIGRWNAVDPLAAEMPSWSPYSYGFNNPVKYTDPDGRFPIIPMLVGAATGAGLDIAVQMGMNYANGRPITKISWTSVGISAGAGATGVGLLTKARTVLNGSTLKATEMAIDATVNMATQYAQDGSIDLRETGLSVVAGQSVRNPTQGKIKAGAQETAENLTKNLNVAEKGLESATNKIRAGLDPSKANKILAPHQKKVAQAKAAKSAHNTATVIDGVIGGGISSGTAQKALNGVIPGQGPVYNLNDHPYVRHPDNRTFKDK